MTDKLTTEKFRELLADGQLTFQHGRAFLKAAVDVSRARDSPSAGNRIRGAPRSAALAGRRAPSRLRDRCSRFHRGDVAMKMLFRP
jgi:hypothetical protein